MVNRTVLDGCRYVVYIVYGGKRSVPMAWSNLPEVIDTEVEYLRGQGHEVEIVDQDAD